MKARTFVAIMIVAGAIGVGARWWQNEVSRPQGPAAPSAAESAVRAHTPAPTIGPATDADEEREPVHEGTQATATAARVQPSEAPDAVGPARIAEVKRAMVAGIDRRIRRAFVEQLTAQGLAPTDSEAIVREALDSFAACSLDALRAQADEQGVPFDDVLYTVEAMLAYADVDVAELIDREAAETRALPCMLGVTQQAGIALP